MLSERFRSVWSDQEGSAFVEGALLMPLLFLLVFGVYEFSWLFCQRSIASVGVRDAARYLARVSNPCDTGSSIWAAEQMQAKNLATTGSTAGGLPRIRGWGADMVALSCTPFANMVELGGSATYRGHEVIYVITVSSRFADPSLGFFSLLRLTPPNIFVSHSERAIGRG
jgi:Flp pilus assembly protein TadG